MNLRALCCVVLCLAVVGCGSGPDGNPSDAGRVNVYSEQTIDVFVTECLTRPGGSVAQCTCMIEGYRAEVAESEFLRAVAGEGTDERAMRIAKRCGQSPVAGSSIVNSAPSPNAAVLDAPAVPAPNLVRAPAATAEVRAATEIEACVQQKIAALTASSAGKSVPLDAFDKIRSECGG